MFFAVLSFIWHYSYYHIVGSSWMIAGIAGLMVESACGDVVLSGLLEECGVASAKNVGEDCGFATAKNVGRHRQWVGNCVIVNLSSSGC